MTEQEWISWCDLCGSEQSKLWMQVGRWRLVRCSTCGLVYLNPRPKAFLYVEDYFSQHITPEGVEIWATDEVNLSALTKAQQWHVALLEQHLPGVQNHRGRILDAGCATGTFLAAARKRGWDVFGVEVSPWGARVATERLKLRVAVGSVEASPFARATFEAITCYHVLEHLPSPRRALAHLHVLLKPDGLLVVEVPNLKSVEARLERAHWRDLDLPLHWYHFTEQTLRALLAQTGFRPIGVRYSLTRYLARLPRRNVTSHAKTSSVQSPRGRLSSLLARCLPGRDLTIYARRLASD